MAGYCAEWGCWRRFIGISTATKGQPTTASEAKSFLFRLFYDSRHVMKS